MPSDNVATIDGFGERGTRSVRGFTIQGSGLEFQVWSLRCRSKERYGMWLGFQGSGIRD